MITFEINNADNNSTKKCKKEVAGFLIKPALKYHDT